MRYSKDAYYKDLDKQKRWIWLRILSKLTEVWSMFVLLFMVVVLLLIILSAPALWFYESIVD